MISIFDKATAKSLRALNSWWKGPRQRRARRAFEAISLRPGDVAIDCGANVGAITRELAQGGADVHAFEPNPLAMIELERLSRPFPNVHCHAAAVSDHDGHAALFLHRKHDQDPLGHSAGSSLVAGKHNLDPAASLTVPVVDLARFIRELNRPVRLLKIDIEGLEVRLLEHLLDQGLLGDIEQVFCETHEFKVAGLWQECRRLRRRLDAAGMRHVNLDWA
ncbi:MAG: FkbM family methyltransferase [Wenzhouxiangella sp.]